MMLKEIMRVTPDLKNTVLPQAKFMDLFWKYFDLTEELKKYMCQLPRLRGKQEEILGNMDFFEANHEPAEEAERKISVLDHGQQRNISADFNDLGVRQNLKETLK